MNMFSFNQGDNIKIYLNNGLIIKGILKDVYSTGLYFIGKDSFYSFLSIAKYESLD